MPSITERAALCRTFILPRCSIPHSNMPNIHNHKGINPIVCAAMTFLLMLPELFMLRGQIWWEAVVATLFNVCFYAALSYLICILFLLAKPRVERALHIVSHSLLVGYSLMYFCYFLLTGIGTPTYSSSLVRLTHARAVSSSTPLSSLITRWALWRFMSCL